MPKTPHKQTYPTFARTKPERSQISKSVVSALLHHDWRKIVLVHAQSEKLLAGTIQTVSYDLHTRVNVKVMVL